MVSKDLLTPTLQRRQMEHTLVHDCLRTPLDPDKTQSGPERRHGFRQETPPTTSDNMAAVGDMVYRPTSALADIHIEIRALRLQVFGTYLEFKGTAVGCQSSWNFPFSGALNQCKKLWLLSPIRIAARQLRVLDQAQLAWDQDRFTQPCLAP